MWHSDRCPIGISVWCINIFFSCGDIYCHLNLWIQKNIRIIFTKLTAVHNALLDIKRRPCELKIRYCDSSTYTQENVKTSEILLSLEELCPGPRRWLMGKNWVTSIWFTDPSTEGEHLLLKVVLHTQVCHGIHVPTFIHTSHTDKTNYTNNNR